MKQRLLLCGKNQALISDIFRYVDENHELMTSSLRKRDLEAHFKNIKYDCIVWCPGGETPEEMRNLTEALSSAGDTGTKTGVIGTERDCRALTDSLAQPVSFALTLPMDSKEVSAQLCELAGTDSHDKKDTERRHILVIDDDPQMLRVIKEMLHDNYDVATAISGKIAYKFLEKRTTDLILLDFEMPDENGPQVLSKLRENDKLSEIPVLFLTGNTDRDKIREAMSLNPQGYLVKPINRYELSESIKKVLG